MFEYRYTRVATVLLTAEIVCEHVSGISKLIMIRDGELTGQYCAPSKSRSFSSVVLPLHQVRSESCTTDGHGSMRNRKISAYLDDGYCGITHEEGNVTGRGACRVGHRKFVTGR